MRDDGPAGEYGLASGITGTFTWSALAVPSGTNGPEAACTQVSGHNIARRKMERTDSRLHGIIVGGWCLHVVVFQRGSLWKSGCVSQLERALCRTGRTIFVLLGSTIMVNGVERARQETCSARGS